MTINPTGRIRLATVWLCGCAGCHMSFLDLDEQLIELFTRIELVFSPLADIKTFPVDVDVVLVEGAVANTDHLREARHLRENSGIVVSFGDCAVTGNVPGLRNRLDATRLVADVYSGGPDPPPPADMPAGIVPTLLPRVLPLHQVIPVDIYLPGCPPDRERIRAVIGALLQGEPVALPETMRSFG